MKVYQIDYDLRKNRNYEPLHDRIRTYPAWCRPLESSWVIGTTNTLTQVRDYLKGAMDSDDGILVTELTGAAAWSGLSAEISDFLKDLLERRAA